jgi:hypothetical protein
VFSCSCSLYLAHISHNILGARTGSPWGQECVLTLLLIYLSKVSQPDLPG